MKRLTLAIVVVTSILGWRALMAQSVPPKVTAEFPGASLKWINIAEAEFQRKKLDVDKYTVSVVEENNSDQQEGFKGIALQLRSIELSAPSPHCNPCCPNLSI